MTETPLIPREVLFGNPRYLSPKLSPDGRLLAYVAPDEGVLNVWVRTVGAEDDQVLTRDRDRGVRSYFWAPDGTRILYLQDSGGNENWRLYGVSLADGSVQDYTPFENVQTQVIQRDKHRRDELLIAMNRDNPQAHDIYCLNLHSGALEKRAENPGNILGWVADSHFDVRAALAAEADGGMSLWYRDSLTADWQTLQNWGMEDSLNSSPSHFSRDGQTLFLMDSQGLNTTALVALDLHTQTRSVLAADPAYDLSQLFVHPDTYAVQAVCFTRARDEWQVLDPAVTEDFAFLQAFAAGDFQIINRDDADTIWLVAYDFDNGPLHYYAYDRQQRAMTFLFAHQPALADYTLAQMEPIELQASDGLTLHGYISFPPGVSRKNLPLVLNVHGGPWWRDTWGYSAEAQWLTNRGYACLQLNFRGSTGYGKAFLNAGDREWGGKMHQDLLDAVDWTVAQGWVDPERVAIYGGSYGGYAALVGATFTPERFRCAVDMVGPSSLLTLIASFPPYWSAMLDNFKRRVGDPDTEPEFLQSRSPLFFVDRIQIPLLIAQGANDPRVTLQEAEQIVAALKAKDLDHEYLLFEDEGHGLAKPDNRMRFYAAMEAFLARCLGGRAQEIAL